PRDRCEYCRLPQGAFRRGFHIEHIIAGQHGGPTAVDSGWKGCISSAGETVEWPLVKAENGGGAASGYFIICASLSFTAAPQISYPLASGCRLSGLNASARKYP